MKTAQNHTRAPRRPGALLGALIGATALLGLCAPAAALAAPVLDVSSSHVRDTVPAGTHARYTLAVSNRGDARVNAPITVEFAAPAGLEVVSVANERLFGLLDTWTCSTPDSQTASCTGPASGTGFGLRPGPGEEACVGGSGATCHIFVTVKADEAAPPGTVTPTFRACGGGHTTCPAEAVSGSDPIDIGPPPEFGLTGFDGETLDEFGVFQNQAGSHPHTAATDFQFTTVLTSDFDDHPVEQFRDAVVELPPGLVGNPQAADACTQAQLRDSSCPAESQVGTVAVGLSGGASSGTGAPKSFLAGVYNMDVPFGLPALFAFNILGKITEVYATLRTGDDYGVTVISKNAPQAIPLSDVDFTFWGVPADPSHDRERSFRCLPSGEGLPTGDICPSDDAADPKPFVSLPTSCTGAPVETFLDVNSWEGSSDSASFLSHDNGGAPIPGADNCAALGAGFAPTLEARPTTNVGDAPSGLDVDLRVPQDDNPNGLATAHLRDTTVTLPEGLAINPSAANGLDGCSPAELGLTTPLGTTPIKTTPTVDNCPPASRIASVQVDTPLLANPMPGSVYLADPFDNPFRSLLALYIVVDDTRTGIVVKLAGKVTPDPLTGRLTATFNDNPQLPFENFRLNFFGGAAGALKTPAICGNHTTTSSLTPWSAPDSGPPADSSDTWAIQQNCVAGPGEQPHAPSFDAGAVSPIAGAHTPFVVKLRREDGSQNFAAVTVRPPLGLTAKLAGTPACSDAALAAAAAKSGAGEKASPSCPAASAVGQVVAGAGAGPAPYYAHGKVYLAGPYKSAPISLATIIPATAGPFDLGTVVTRIAAHINPATAEITAVSDNLPTILQGIPLNVKSVDVSLDKPDFSLNGTSCDPTAVNGLLTSTLGAVANLSARFQLGECTSLGFKPRLAIRLKGGTARGKYPQLSAYVLPREGDANIRSVSVSFPRSEFLANEHIRTICTRPQFAADQCPQGSIYGTSTVFTPLLDYPLTGNVHLRSSDNLLPDLVPDLRGPAYQPIRVQAAGRTDSVRGGIRNTFDFFPDAPFSKAVLKMQGGNKGLLVNSRNICARTYRAVVKFTGHDAELLRSTERGVWIDGTLGGGGHAARLLEANPESRLIGFDRDGEALEAAARRLAPWAERLTLVNQDFRDAAAYVASETETMPVRGVLLDLGVSSYQLDEQARGFSFRRSTPLDMRMGGTTGGRSTAAEVLNESSEDELGRIFREYGEERRWRALAREVAKRRTTEPFETSDDFVAACTVVLGGGLSAATKARLFQALRIAVNDELEALSEALPALRDVLTPGGRIAVIAYHSLEDRIVKNAFREWSRDCVCPPELPECRCRGAALGRSLTRKPVRPSEAEVAANPRARSARLRAWARA